MKKSLFVFLLLALCLPACTPAASSVPDPAPTPTEEAPAETTTAEETAAVVGNLQSIMQRRNTGEACYTYQAMQGEIQKLDYASASVETLYRFGEPGTVYSDVIVEPDALYAVTADTLYKVPLDGGETTTQPLQNLPGSRTPAWCDERGAYIVEGNPFNPPEQNVACRIDLETGAITDLPLPHIVLDGVFAADGSRLLLRRCVTEQPLPSFEEQEAFDAALQNATSEYDWWDLNTGKLEKVLEEPYEGTVDAEGTISKMLFLGKAEGRLYFETVVYNPDKGNLPGQVVSYRLDGSDQKIEAGISGSVGYFAPMERDGELYWLVDNNSDRMHVYDVATSTDYDVRPGLQSTGYPVTFTGDGRVLVVAKQYEKGPEDYGLISIDDFLAGSSNWTPVEGPEGGTVIVF